MYNLPRRIVNDLMVSLSTDLEFEKDFFCSGADLGPDEDFSFS